MGSFQTSEIEKEKPWMKATIDAFTSSNASSSMS
jgi:hypothetical protein